MSGESSSPPKLIAGHAEHHRRGQRLQTGCLMTFLIWLAAVAGWFGMGKISPVEREKWQWLLTVLAILLGFVLPVAGLLQAWELKGYLDWKAQGSSRSFLPRFLIILGCWLVGILAGTMGTLGFYGAVQDGLVLADALPLLFCLALIALALFLIVFPFRRTPGKTEAEESAEWLAYRQQLLSPEFEALEQLIGAPLPDRYKELFAPGSAWLDHSWEILPEGPDAQQLYEFSRLLPAHVSALRRHSKHPELFVAFGEAAEDGDELWISLETANPVYYRTCAEQAEEEIGRISDSLATFLSWPRNEI